MIRTSTTAVYIHEAEFHSEEPATPVEPDLRNADQSQCSLNIEHQSAAIIISSSIVQ